MLMLVRPLVLVSVLLACVPRAAADYPIVSHRHLADPAALVHDGRVYIYCSNDDDSPLQGGYEMKSLVCVSSSDMKNWTDHGEVIRVPRDASWAVHTWAPAVIERNGTFFLYFSNNASGIGVATSDSPAGPFKDPLGRPLIDARTPGVLPATNMWIFDPAVFIDHDGQAYLYFGGNGESNLRIIRLNEDMISVQGSAQSVTVPNFFEAAWMHERDGRYYLSYSTVPSAGMRIDYLMSDHPAGPFTYAGVVAAQPPLNDNNNHAAIFELNGAWYHVYHNRAFAREQGIPAVYRRNLAVEQIVYQPEGYIQQVEYTRDGVPQAHVLNPYQRIEAETFAAQSGIETTRSAEGGMSVTSIEAGDWIRVRGVDFGSGGAGRFTARVASAGMGGRLVLRLENADGPVVGQCDVGSTGGGEMWAEVDCDVTGATGVQDLYLTFEGEGASLFSIDWWQFESSVPTLRTQPRPLTVAPGGRAMFWVEAEATGPLDYQWTLNGATIAGAKEPVLTLSSVTPEQAGDYRVVLTSPSGATTSQAATLTVQNGVGAELTNLSARASLGEGEVLISGFVIGSVE